MLVPNVFTVELSPPDFDRLNPFSTTLADELATLVKEHVSEQRYTMAGPLEIAFTKTGELSTAASAYAARPTPPSRRWPGSG
jgi:hypothetical protein